MFQMPIAQDGTADGLTKEQPIRLDGIKRDDFRQLLRIMYPRWADPWTPERFQDRSHPCVQGDRAIRQPQIDGVDGCPRASHHVGVQAHP